MKKQRHEKILELIEKKNVETQEELADLLCKSGYDVTQATVSRDIRNLKLTKIPYENGRQKYTKISDDHLEMGEKYIRVLKDGLISMEGAGNILVVKTVSGMAMAVAAAFDTLKLPEIVGTIAGDDTIMMAIRTIEDVEEVISKINNLLG